MPIRELFVLLRLSQIGEAQHNDGKRRSRRGAGWRVFRAISFVLPLQRVNSDRLRDILSARYCPCRDKWHGYVAYCALAWKASF